jgi:AcrR family transcriptional regulator
MGTQSTGSSTATPASRWARRKERTHRRLLEAADALFRSQGFDATTVEEIADAADVAKGTFFNYFESKASLLGAILYMRTQPLLNDPPGAGAEAPTRIRILLEALWDALSPYQPLARRMLAHIVSHSPPTSCYPLRPWPPWSVRDKPRASSAMTSTPTRSAF